MSKFIDPVDPELSDWFQLRQYVVGDEDFIPGFTPWPTFDEMQSRVKEDWLVTRASDFRDWVLQELPDRVEEFAHPEARFIDVNGFLHFAGDDFSFADVLGLAHSQWVTVDSDELPLETMGTTTFLLQEVSPTQGAMPCKVVWSLSWLWENEDWVILNSHASYHQKR